MTNNYSECPRPCPAFQMYGNRSLNLTQLHSHFLNFDKGHGGHIVSCDRVSKTVTTGDKAIS